MSEAVQPTDSNIKQVVLYTCPTGGWVMGNRTLMEESIKSEIPNAQVTHKVACPLTAVVEIDGKKGKREVGPFLFFCPASCRPKTCESCCNANVTGANAKELYESLSMKR